MWVVGILQRDDTNQAPGYVDESFRDDLISLPMGNSFATLHINPAPVGSMARPMSLSRSCHGSRPSMRSPPVAPGRAGTISLKTAVVTIHKIRGCQSLTVCVPSQSFNLLRATPRLDGSTGLSRTGPQRCLGSALQRPHAETSTPWHPCVVCGKPWRAGGEFGVDQAVDGLRVRYSLESNGDLELLDDLQWADWSREGQLLVATRSGMLQVRSFDSDRPEITFEEDLSGLEPNRTPSPPWARHW
jgi:hypothetical protein